MSAVEAIGLSPILRTALSQDAINMLSRGQPERAYQEVERQIDQLLAAEHQHRNHRSTWAWAVRRYGSKALTLLGIALEDPCIRSRGRFFGWLATTAESINLTPNLKRIRERLPASAGEPPTPTIPELYQLIEPKHYQAWFSDCRLIVQNSAAVLVAPTPFVADWIRSHFFSELRLLARAQGHSSIEVAVQPSGGMATQLP